MSKIDDLPLDIFDEHDPAGAAPAASAQAASNSEPAIVPWATPEPQTSTKIYDAAGVVAATIALGLALRVLGAGFTTPVLNVAIALVVYFRLKSHHKQRYYDRASALLSRMQSELAAVQGQEVPHQVAAYRIAYDIGIVVVASIAIRIALWMSGFDHIIPDPLLFTTSLALAIAAYALSIQRIGRDTLHVWVYERIHHLKRSS